MKQVELFSSCDTTPYFLQKMINTWLAQNQGKKIVDIKFTSGIDGDEDTFFSAMIIYEEN